MASLKLFYNLPYFLVIFLFAILWNGNKTLVSAYSEKENLDFIERIINQLNNRYECQLPAYNEVDEMQDAFAELESKYGSAKFETMLSDDMRLVRRTLLDQWTSFQQRMSSNVVIRAAKRRSFICKVEEYQLAKYKDSVCTRFKDVRNKITDRIFEKNPIVRYVKHLDTEQVVEGPDWTEATRQVDNEASDEQVKTVGQVAGEDQNEKPEHSLSTVQRVDDDSDDGDDDDKEGEHETIAPVVYKNLADGLKPGDHYIGEDGNPRVFLGRFTMNQEEKDGSKRQVEFKLDQYLNYDPLEEIPVPKSTDGGEEERKDSGDDDEDDEVEEEISTTTTTTTEAPATTIAKIEENIPTSEEPTATTTELELELELIITTTEVPQTIVATEEPLFDELGAAFIDIDEDDYDLTRVVRLPKKDWEFDQVFGYFKWPDEDENEGELELMHLDRTVGHEWADLLLDPYVFDQYMNSLRTTTTPRPKINGAMARRKKQEFFKSMQAEERRGQTFGWTFEATPQVREQTMREKPVQSLQMPPAPKDRWVKVLNNNVCKLGYNKDSIKRKAKGGYKAMKSWFKSRVGDEEDLEME